MLAGVGESALAEVSVSVLAGVDESVLAGLVNRLGRPTSFEAGMRLIGLVWGLRMLGWVHRRCGAPGSGVLQL